MKEFIQKYNQWFIPVALIMLLLHVIMLPYTFSVTYSGRSESPNHVLTYNMGNLTWDSATGIDANGVAKLDLFDAVYESVASADGSNVVAPGTEGFNIVRLKNNVVGSVNYTAVLYRITSNENLPVSVNLSGDNFVNTGTYGLPDGVSKDQVVRAVTGTLKGHEIQDFDIRWMWDYYEDEEQDAIDTALGSKEDADQVTVGLYVVVEDNNNYSAGEPGVVGPSTPQTGDTTQISMYLALMCISGLVLLLLWHERKREKEQCGE